MNSKQLYTVPQRNFLLLGAVLVIIGSFSPWEIEGDFISTWRYGIQVFPVFVDNGGILILLLGVVILGLVFRSEGFIKYPTQWVFTSSIALFIISFIILWIGLSVALLRMELSAHLQ